MFRLYTREVRQKTALASIVLPVSEEQSALPAPSWHSLTKSIAFVCHCKAAPFCILFLDECVLAELGVSLNCTHNLRKELLMPSRTFTWNSIGLSFTILGKAYFNVPCLSVRRPCCLWEQQSTYLRTQDNRETLVCHRCAQKWQGIQCQVIIQLVWFQQVYRL